MSQKLKHNRKKIDHLYIQDEIEFSKPPEFILIYFVHQHQIFQTFLVVQFKIFPQ